MPRPRITQLRNADARALLFGSVSECWAVFERLGRERVIRWARSVAGRAQIAKLNAERTQAIAPATLYAWADTPPPRSGARCGPRMPPTNR